MRSSSTSSKTIDNKCFRRTSRSPSCSPSYRRPLSSTRYSPSTQWMKLLPSVALGSGGHSEWMYLKRRSMQPLAKLCTWSVSRHIIWVTSLTLTIFTRAELSQKYQRSTTAAWSMSCSFRLARNASTKPCRCYYSQYRGSSRIMSCSTGNCSKTKRRSSCTLSNRTKSTNHRSSSRVTTLSSGRAHANAYSPSCSASLTS